MKLFYRLPQTLLSIYSGKNFLWQIVAVLLTLVIVLSGFDWFYYESSRNFPWIFILPGIALGGIIPIVVPLCLFILGGIKKNKKMLTLGWALGQAALLGLAISSFYKAFTGRIPPPEAWTHFASETAQALADTSLGFQFGFLRGGVFWGWPSSHTTVAFAMGAALFALFPHEKIARWIGLVWSLYVGLSISISIHWFSEFVAGAIVGTIIGLAVGKAFYKLQGTL